MVIWNMIVCDKKENTWLTKVSSLTKVDTRILFCRIPNEGNFLGKCKNGREFGGYLEWV